MGFVFSPTLVFHFYLNKSILSLPKYNCYKSEFILMAREILFPHIFQLLVHLVMYIVAHFYVLTIEILSLSFDFSNSVKWSQGQDIRATHLCSDKFIWCGRCSPQLLYLSVSVFVITCSMMSL